jgi:hypothetical protein
LAQLLKNRQQQSLKHNYMKKTLLILAAFWALTVQAQEQKVIAIIDTAIDSSKFNNIVYIVHNFVHVLGNRAFRLSIISKPIKHFISCSFQTKLTIV